MSNGLSRKDISAFKMQLLKLRDALQIQDTDSARWRDTVELDQQSVGRLSRMDALQQQAMSEAEARRRQADLQRIEHALKLIAEGEYGWCSECGEPIAIKRLEIDPMASHCIACAK